MGIFQAILGICKTKQLDDELWSIKDGSLSFKLSDATDLAKEDGAVYLKKRQGMKDHVLVVHSGKDQYYAYKNRCTHFGRKIDPIPSQKKLKCCSINHSQFNMDGEVLSGPAKGNLVRYKISKDGDTVNIDLNTE
jgi:cytochrome b6-f complex iron-sulfur subunit